MEKIQRSNKGRKDQASQMRQNAEIQNLYKKNNVSMFGSFATFLTLPIMFAMWQAVQRIDILYSTYIFGINLGLSQSAILWIGYCVYCFIGFSCRNTILCNANYSNKWQNAHQNIVLVNK